MAAGNDRPQDFDAIAFRGVYASEGAVSAVTGKRLAGGAVQTLEFHLPHSQEAPALARRLAEEQLMPLLPRRRADELILLVSEVVSNAVQHSDPLADGTIGLHIETTDDAIRVAATDGGRHLVPDGLGFHTKDNGHFGLFLVDAWADRWGFSLDGVKGVWFMVDRDDG